MTYATLQAGEPKYSGRLTASANDGSQYYAEIYVDFQLGVNGVAVAAPDVEGFADPNFQDFLDYVADWPGFSLPSGSEYTTISATQVYANKQVQMGGEVTPTP